MKYANSMNSDESRHDAGFSPWQWLKSKQISYLTLPLLIMATIVEFVILATGWKYQQAVCLPKGMGVTFFGIGPIGATILAVELLKLPLAIWTASRQGWQKGFMLLVGLPLICVLTFQLVKDMAVYEMGSAMAPASQLLEKAAAEEIKIAQLNNELAALEQKKTDADQKRIELVAKQSKAKADFEESLKHLEASRQDAISLTDYQKKELSEVESRQAAIIKQFDADTEQLTKAITALRAQREVEVARASDWNAEEARIENAYKAKMLTYSNLRAAYEKAKAEYDSAHFVVRKFMTEPVDPGMAPTRAANAVLKPVEIAEIDSQIKTKEAELLAVNNKRRERVAQVDADARRVREDFDRRSSTKREDADRKREELLAAQAALSAQWLTESKQIDQAVAAAALKVDVVRGEVDACRTKAEGFYAAREDAIKNTQVHRIATTVEIVRGLLFGQRPVSVTASAKERGDLYTDQISMVRIWVYPFLAFIVAFLPTLMVEIGFSTVFKPAKERPPYRVGLLGRGLHKLYIRAGRHKMLRAERMAQEAAGAMAARDRALATATAAAEKALADKEAELQALRSTTTAAAAAHAESTQKKEEQWVAKYTELADSLNRAVVEKDALRDLQKSEIERQIQLRQHAWSDRLTQLRKELDDQRAASETERATLLQEHHAKLMAVTEDCQNQLTQMRRQLADAELAAVEKNAQLVHDLKAAGQARDLAEAQLQHQATAAAAKLKQVQEDAAHELEKAMRSEKHRAEQQQMEAAKALRQRDEDFAHRLQQREQELTLALSARLDDEKAKLEQAASHREAELTRQHEARAREVEARWTQEVQQREATAQLRLKQREQQLQAAAEARSGELQARAGQEQTRQELEAKRQLEAQTRAAELRLRLELQQQEQAFQIKLRQVEQELAGKLVARETELQAQRVAELRSRELEWERQTEASIRAVETRLRQETEQKEEQFQAQARHRDQQWQAKLDAVRADAQAQTEQELRRHEKDASEARHRAQRELEARLQQELQAKLEATHAANKQREQDLVAQLNAKVAAYQTVEQERDEARKIAFEVAREVQDLKDKLTEASSLLTGWNSGSGKNPVSQILDKKSAAQYIVK